jgi:hypothetical protein
MKKLLLVTGTYFLVTAKLFAQDCTQYVYMQKDKTIGMTMYKKNGDVTMMYTTTVTDVKTDNGVTTASVSSQAYDKHGKEMGSVRNATYKCDGGVFSVDMNVNMPQQNDAKQAQPAAKMEITSNSSFTEFPHSMSIGDHLKDAITTMETTGNNGMTFVMTVKVTDRIVAGKETVTTPAGTWDCLKITSNITSSTTFKGAQADTLNKAMIQLDKLRAKLGGLGAKMGTPAPTVIKSTICFVPDFGVVKTESKDSYAELTSLK